MIFKKNLLALVVSLGLFSTITLADADPQSFYNEVDFKTVQDSHLDELEKEVLSQKVRSENPLVDIGRYAYFRGFLLQNTRDNLDLEKAKVALDKCILKSNELGISENTFVQKYAWNLSCSMQLFKFAMETGDGKEMARILLPASDILRDLVTVDKGDSWLALKSNVSFSNTNSSFAFYPNYYGGLIYRAIAEIYVQMETFFINKSPLITPMVYAMKDIVGGTSMEDIRTFRKNLCKRAREFYQHSIDIEEMDSELERVGEEFLANFRVGARTEMVCGDQAKAKQLLAKGKEVYEAMLEDEFATAEDAAEIHIFNKLETELSK